MFNNPDWSSKNIVTNYNDLAQRSFLKSYYWHSLISLIRSNTFNNPESNILEIGCGPGWISIISKFLSPNCNYYSIDLSSEMINTAKSNAGSGITPALIRSRSFAPPGRISLPGG